ncbi:unnamed protein product [marine sediment metagenome]|uniref:Uncharacterized protein n=1 Tax=marine sediment metagenome TaxID=412755 RepID=X0ZR59_9ZZZZ
MTYIQDDEDPDFLFSLGVSWLFSVISSEEQSSLRYLLGLEA